MKINNRRYIGCKSKLLDNIFKTVQKFGFSAENSIADIFAGTGVVAERFASNGFKTIVNDTLYSNIVVYKALLGGGELRPDVIEKYLRTYNSIDSTNLEENYFSKIYGGKYFAENDAKKIGYIRDLIEENKKELTEREYFYFISSLLYATDKIANTVGHFESFLKKEPVEKGIGLNSFEIIDYKYPSQIFNMDANQLVRSIKTEIAYIDPPYNARQYVNFYHVLENLARWNKPTEFEGNSMKFKRNELKSDYCRNKAPSLFSDLIENLKCKLIIVSYNNTYKAGSISSVNTISSDYIIKTLEAKGKLSVEELNYKAFNSGKTELQGHKEYLYICEVGK
ncbi:DNA adenine methylase [uncultured Treponema sp.]|uniref:DNA adenine methylase n=1 Tax=uncultured Treponema sp. TaxID=162155 RepID=UPI00258B9A33|nr:DNA adenine methylase [uncultured Treponema sp.]